MTKHRLRPMQRLTMVFALSQWAAWTAAQTSPEWAAQLLRRADFTGGVILQIGCGNGELTTALAHGDGRLVHALDTDAQAVARTRERLLQAGLYGTATADLWTGEALPYVNNLAAIAIVAPEPGSGIPDTELLRVLRPGAAALRLHAAEPPDQPDLIRKPWPADIDSWTHFLHDSGGNAVARDQRVGPPRAMQWLADPVWTRNHHRLASVSSVVAADARLFYIVDHATAAAMQVPGNWSVVARDAFSGLRLWERPLPSWAWHGHRFRSGPVQLPRLLVASPERVYVPLGLGAPVSALDARTGRLLATYAPTAHAEEMVQAGDMLYVLCGSAGAEQAAVAPKGAERPAFPNRKSVAAVDLSSGTLRWRWPENADAGVMPLTLAALHGRVFLQVDTGLVCLDGATGAVHWRLEPEDSTVNPKRNPGWSVATVVAHGDTVYWADGKQLRAADAATGTLRWVCPCTPTFHSPVDVLLSGGLLWLGPEFSEGRDPKTGEVQARNDVAANLWTVGHHHRCYRNKATDRFIMTAKRGVEFIDLRGSNHSRNNWVRGVCQYGILPCNGLLYAPPHTCGCYIEAKLYGFWALAAEAAAPPPAPTPAPLEKGPARHAAGNHGKHPSVTPKDWPTYRADAQRRAATAAELPEALSPRWTTPVGTHLSAPIAVADSVFVSDVDTGRLVALDADTGAARWSWLAGGRIDSPPTWSRGRLLVGSADGWITCLADDDGTLIWRRRLAPQDRRTVVRERLESVWPVHGSILVLNDIAYATAGRSSYLDGGMLLTALDPATGTILHQTRLRTPHPDYADPETRRMRASMAPLIIDQNAVDGRTLEDPDRSDAFGMGGVRSDLLVSDGTRLFLRHRAFTPELVAAPGRYQHLFSTTFLLDGSEIHRTHMVLGVGNFLRLPVAYSWIANSFNGRRGAGLVAPYGLLLCFDDTTVWGVRRHQGYTLFASPRDAAGEALLRGVDVVQRGTRDPVRPVWTWSTKLDLRPRSLIHAGDQLLIAGTPLLDSTGGVTAFAGQGKGLLRVLSDEDGAVVAACDLPAAPVWDGAAVANGYVYLSTATGHVLALGPRK